MIDSRKRLYGVAGGLGIVCMLGALLVVRAASHGGSATQKGVGAASTPSVPSSPTSTVTPAQTPSPTPVPSPASASVTLTLQGTRFYSHGRLVTLLGASRSSLEYSCTGDGHFQAGDYQAMKRWGMNVVRITLSSAFWANAGESCPSYRTTVARAVSTARAAGLFVILNLQWSAPIAMPDSPQDGGAQCPLPDAGKDLAMWQDLATMYRTDTGVLFDLYGEPQNVSWSKWLNGGTLALSGSAACYDWNSPGVIPQYGTYQAVGMRTLVAKIRAIAPSTIVILAGLDWGYDLTGITQGFAVAGRNIAYATHPWNTGGRVPSDWAAKFGAESARYPVIATEFGEYDCGTSYDAALIPYFNAHHISWLAWNWLPGPCGGNGATIIADWSGAPNGPYGTFLHDQMLAVARENG
jgi:endoglucanase